MNKFAKYLGEKFKLTVGGEELELDIRLKDVNKLLSAMSKMGETPSEESLNKVTEACLDILKRSYPDENPEAIEKFLMKNLPEFLEELSITLGWTGREELEKKLESMKKKGEF